MRLRSHSLLEVVVDTLPCQLVEEQEPRMELA